MGAGRRWCCVLLAWLLWCGAPGAALRPFEAHYRLSRDGLPVGETRVRLERLPQDGYRYSAFTRPNALTGLWRDDLVEEVSEGDLVEGRPRPRYYSYHRHGGAPRALEIRFDWEEGRLRVSGDGGGWSARLPPGTLDKLVQQWALSLDLARTRPLPVGGPLVSYPVADGGRIKTYAYEIDAVEGEGTERRVRVRRSKDAGGTDYRLWFSPARGWLPVRIERRYGGHLWRMELIGPDAAVAD